MDQLDEFARDLFAAAPELPGAMQAIGDDPAPDHEIPTLWLAQAGSALSGLVGSLPEARVAATMDVVERYVSLGSHAWQEALCTGLLEAMASEVSARRLDPKLLARVLGPQSRAYIDAWDDFSLGRSSLEG